MKTSLFLLSTLLLVSGCSPQPVPQNPSEYFDVFETHVGSVNFPNSCNKQASPLVERGVALLHHMMYSEAEFLFNTALFEDPECAVALWGKSMTIIHPLWPGGPSNEDLERGLALVKQASGYENTTARENAYIGTTFAYFNTNTQAKRIDRLVNFEGAWKRVSEQFPDDNEAKAFYALSMIATANKGDLSYKKQQNAAEVAKSVVDAIPEHPGAHHYIIHAYDLPGLASKASDYAINYGEMTPKVPHASHMLSHIYTRLGEWQKSIAWNITSSDTAWEMCVSSGVVNSHYTHALDYLTYAYLQMGNDQATKKILADLNNLKPPYNKTNHASAYAFAAVPARYAVERYDWTAATELSPRSPMDFPWEPSHAPYVAITHFVKAIAFSRLKRPNEATAEIAELYQLKEQTADKQAYWSNQISIQIKSAEAWQLYTSGNVEQGLAMMKDAADMEMATQKHPITPGSVIPANELFGDMLSESGLFEQAISAYNASLQRNPKRLNSLIGIGQSYVEMQDIESATDTLKRINRQVNGASVQRPKIEAITDYVNSAL